MNKELAKQVSEEMLQAQVLTYATLRGWLSYHTHDSRRSSPGFPDLVLVRGKRLVFAELKTEKGVLSTAQKEWGQKLFETGSEYYVWKPSNWEDIETLLR